MAYTAIDNPELYFQAKAYSGTGSSQAYTLDGDEDMSPNFVWIKNRGESNAYHMYDTVRGVEKRLRSNGNNAETDESGGLTAFGSDGFTVNTSGAVNGSGENYVTWCWKESATAGFDIVAYTGNGTDDTDIAHTLSAVPHLMLVKKRDDGGAVESWCVYHHKNTSAPETDYLRLDSTAATDDQADRWSDEVPTSSVFTVGTSDETNRNTSTYINYLWSEKQGFSKFGSYTGNGNADGAFIYTGFRPAWFLCKNTQDAGDNWILHDNKRDTFNVTDNGLAPNDSGAEFTDVDMDFLSNGVKMRNNTGRSNGTSKSFIYMAFAEAPFVNSNGVPCNAR